MKSYKKNAFSGFCQKFPQAMHKVEKIFCQFPNLWTLRVSGMGGYTSKCEKNQNHCTLFLIYDFVTAPIWISLYMMEIFLFFFISVLKIKMVLFEWPVMVFNTFGNLFMRRISKVKLMPATMKPLTNCENPFKVTLSSGSLFRRYDSRLLL